MEITDSVSAREKFPWLEKIPGAASISAFGVGYASEELLRSKAFSGAQIIHLDWSYKPLLSAAYLYASTQPELDTWAHKYWTETEAYTAKSAALHRVCRPFPLCRFAHGADAVTVVRHFKHSYYYFCRWRQSPYFTEKHWQVETQSEAHIYLPPPGTDLASLALKAYCSLQMKENKHFSETINSRCKPRQEEPLDAALERTVQEYAAENRKEIVRQMEIAGKCFTVRMFYYLCEAFLGGRE